MKYQKSKDLIKKILDQEIKETGVDIKVFPLTKNENMKEELKKLSYYIKEFNIDSLNIMLFFIKNYSKYSGYYDNNKYELIRDDQIIIKQNSTDLIKIHLDTIYKNNRNLKNEFYLFELIRTTYHEYQHKLTRENITKNKFQDFIIAIEELQKKLILKYIQIIMMIFLMKYYQMFIV